jgi:Hg(II)-responsive transcriptional regulator
MDSNGRTIGELARDAGVHVETIRYYEQRGLLKQPRRSQGWRRYDDEALRVLRFVKRGQELGFSLDEVHELLSLRASRSPRACARVRAAAESKLADVEAKIRDLEAIRDKLSDLSRMCPSDGPPVACPILGALDWNGSRHDA